MSFFGHLFAQAAPSGLRHGMEAGLEWEKKGLQFLVRAVESGNAEQIAAIVAVAKQNVTELENISNVTNLFLSGGDPCQGSRHALEALLAKWPL